MLTKEAVYCARGVTIAKLLQAYID